MFPVDETITTGQDSYSYTDDFGNVKTGTHTLYGTVNHTGMSKRLFIATMAMQGLIMRKKEYQLPEDIAVKAYQMADALLEREDE